MGDKHGYAPLGFLLEVIVATVLIGTFVLYGTPVDSGSPAAAPGEIAHLDTSR
jgi:hypothetical protein